MKLIASRSMTYATRRLKAGDPFTARTALHARVLVAAKRAKRATKGDAPKSGPKLDDDGFPQEITDLRALYQAEIGTRPFMGWDADMLITKIKEKRASA